MKVVFISHSDTDGGAAVVTLRLVRALRDAGVDASMLVTHNGSGEPFVHLAGNSMSRRAAFLAECAGIYTRNGFSRADLFKASTASHGLPLHRHPLVRQADVIVLGWVNQGTLSIAGIERIAASGKKIIWTMHDMWNMTGICHHAGECSHYAAGGKCGFCPLIHHRRRSESDLSRSTWQRKQRLYTSDDITFVAVSNWLAGCARRSTLMADAHIEVIPNAFPLDEFYITPRNTRAEAGLPESGHIILMGARRLDDPIKGFPIAIAALNELHGRIAAGTAPEACAVFFGDLRDRSLLDGLRLPHLWFGSVTDPVRVAELYAHADAVLSSSLYETLPGTLIEGLAAGCRAVSFGRGGQPDIIDSPELGFIADYLSPASLADGLAEALRSDPDRGNLRLSVENKFAAASVARRYMALFNI